MADVQDPTYLPEHVGQVNGALSATITSNGGQDFTRREGPGGRKSEFAAGAMRGAVQNADSKTLAKAGGTLKKIFAGAAAVE